MTDLLNRHKAPNSYWHLITFAKAPSMPRKNFLFTAAYKNELQKSVLQTKHGKNVLLHLQQPSLDIG
jgi:hypothetical protein